MSSKINIHVLAFGCFAAAIVLLSQVSSNSSLLAISRPQLKSATGVTSLDASAVPKVHSGQTNQMDSHQPLTAVSTSSPVTPPEGTTSRQSVVAPVAMGALVLAFGVALSRGWQKVQSAISPSMGRTPLNSSALQSMSAMDYCTTPSSNLRSQAFAAALSVTASCMQPQFAMAAAPVVSPPAAPPVPAPAVEVKTTPPTAASPLATASQPAPPVAAPATTAAPAAPSATAPGVTGQPAAAPSAAPAAKPAAEQLVVKGPAKVLDGDALLVTNQDGSTTRVRLQGIDAPELKQTCLDAKGQPYDCGVKAKQYLEKLVGTGTVECVGKRQPQYNRILGVCYDTRTGKDLNKEMVLSGEAAAYTISTKAYVDDEVVAKQQKKGLWQGQFQNPWEYRKEKRNASKQPAAAAAPKVEKVVAGKARVVDGDTLVLTTAAGQESRVRLLGIDAPESTQVCKEANGKSYQCGQESKAYLEKLIGTDPVECATSTADQYGRAVGVCFDQKTKKELNQAMVEAGEAVAYREFSNAYVDEELAAQNKKQGIWRGTFDNPADFRKTNEVAVAAPAAPKK